ncbi:hypothetical protein AF335_17055 [Streptomyces eurocidicus]|uniref:Uncharacterized protein n=1 Tax=Streptomyces eurocidicus TaxID=66423 RepID=A0A2N8NU80_STREU|nr:hypothetical protein AF335_17055 [Streptomyces eurocidicus]
MDRRCADASPYRAMRSWTIWWSAAARLRQSRTCSRVRFSRSSSWPSSPSAGSFTGAATTTAGRGPAGATGTSADGCATAASARACSHSYAFTQALAVTSWCSCHLLAARGPGHRRVDRGRTALGTAVGLLLLAPGGQSWSEPRSTGSSHRTSPHY